MNHYFIYSITVLESDVKKTPLKLPTNTNNSYQRHPSDQIHNNTTQSQELQILYEY